MTRPLQFHEARLNRALEERAAIEAELDRVNRRLHALESRKRLSPLIALAWTLLIAVALLLGFAMGTALLETIQRAAVVESPW